MMANHRIDGSVRDIPGLILLQKSREQVSERSTRDVVVAYLSYALDDVAALSPSALPLLQLAIAAISKGTNAEEAAEHLQ